MPKLKTLIILNYSNLKDGKKCPRTEKVSATDMLQYPSGKLLNITLPIWTKGHGNFKLSIK
ncbi:hypothetical protein B1L02_18940 [Pseudoalteromonas piscicida]|uniref:Uncharacterized protein n=1 Tax=Pseudoalteromonas piscicida TaxID=43662 RepID=A0AAD0RKK2_PSEO7|nr:hypothetical protein B1L02_18940 [Pseudoalteromonas piscicida]AXR00525.1 hypothetical protein D0N37_23820 [Pseudoalteromonas piscicida]AXR04622.1 hypothetical protein D0511_22385 [Pseudoalteromonas piscicida]